MHSLNGTYYPSLNRVYGTFFANFEENFAENAQENEQSTMNLPKLHRKSRIFLPTYCCTVKLCFSRPYLFSERYMYLRKENNCLGEFSLIGRMKLSMSKSRTLLSVWMFVLSVCLSVCLFVSQCVSVSLVPVWVLFSISTE